MDFTTYKFKDICLDIAKMILLILKLKARQQVALIM